MFNNEIKSVKDNQIKQNFYIQNLNEYNMLNAKKIQHNKILNINGLDCFYQLEELIIEINPSIHHISFESETLKKIIIKSPHFISFNGLHNLPLLEEIEIYESGNLDADNIIPYLDKNIKKISLKMRRFTSGSNEKLTNYCYANNIALVQ